MISIVIGLQYGDEGKGVVTDSLITSSDDIVIRFSGGQQAGHTVIRNGVKHVHSQYGSGTLQNAYTYFSEHTTIHLDYLLRERNVLIEKGIYPKPIYVHPLAKITTHYDVMYNKAKSLYMKHGTCGMGVGATHKRDENNYKLRAIDLTNKDVFLEKYRLIKEYYESKFSQEKLFFNFTESLLLENDYMNAFDKLNELCIVEDYNILTKFNNIVFEGSQGIMLDMEHGFFPNVTYSNTTSKNAFEIIDKAKLKDDIKIYYASRCYQTRHGNGYMTSKEPITLINTEEEINNFDEYQGYFRTAELDYSLLDYALRVDSIYCKTNSKNLVITCLDQRPDFKFIQTDYIIKNIEQIIYRNSAKN